MRRQSPIRVMFDMLLINKAAEISLVKTFAQDAAWKSQPSQSCAASCKTDIEKEISPEFFSLSDRILTMQDRELDH